jgi:ethanolamine utilization microcompartment shell protein EutS
MRLTSQLTPRQFLIIAHDLIATAVAIVITYVMRFVGSVLVE